jgi:hypothetical protein
MKKVLQWSSISTKLATTSHLKPFITKTKEEQDMALEIKVNTMVAVLPENVIKNNQS